VKKKLFLILVATLAVLMALVLVRTAQFTSTHEPVEPVRDIAIDEDQAARHLAEAVRFKTVSNRDRGQVDWDVFVAFRAFLAETYPRLHASLKRELVNDHALLYTWPGKDPASKPVILLAHHDVVPAPEEGEWKHPPFAGVIEDGYVWGRGTLDNKGSFLGIFEAVEALLGTGFQPARTVHIASGQDEEVSGLGGAAAIVELLESRHVEPEFVLDEGGAVIVDMIPGVDVPVAALGISEKGYATLELTAESEGGHSSTPPHQTAVGIVSAAVAALEANPMPANMDHAAQFFHNVGPEMPLLQRMIFANLWLFEPLVKRVLRADPAIDATIRTTTAATLFNAGVKDNVLPRNAAAAVNFRILPGDSVDSVVEHARSVINDDRVNVALRGEGTEPSPVSSIEAPGYAAIETSARQVIGEGGLVVSPFLVLGGSDARFFSAICPNVYRFLPFTLGPGDLKGIHGVNERIATHNFAQAIRFYYQLLRNCEHLPVP